MGVLAIRIAAAAALPAAQRRALGLKCVSLTRLINNRRLTDAAVEKLLDKIGEARVWTWLESRTKPMSEAAE
jgi:hypothetical protein